MNAPVSSNLVSVIWQVMYRLADLLDGDHFNNIEAIVREAGVPFPPDGYDGRPMQPVETTAFRGLKSISYRPDFPLVDLVMTFESMEAAQAARARITDLVMPPEEPKVFICGVCNVPMTEVRPGEWQHTGDCLPENGSVPQQPPVDNDHVAPGCEKFDE